MSRSGLRRPWRLALRAGAPSRRPQKQKAARMRPGREAVRAVRMVASRSECSCGKYLAPVERVKPILLWRGGLLCMSR
jgi:hypothetical protein